MEQIIEIPIDQIKVGEHAQRLEKNDPDIEMLSESIKRIGILNPLLVVGGGDDLHLVAGHRRIVAARVAGLKVVPCIIRTSEKAVDQEITFAENFFRKDLSPVELACALKDCIDQEVMTVQELAEGFRRKEHWVRSMIAIASWPGDVQEAIHDEVLSVSAASNLALVTDENYRAFLLRNAEESGATARTTSAWLQAWRSMQPPEEAVKAEPLAGHIPAIPAVPQAPCFCCGTVFPVDRMSHVPVCGGCVQTIRQIGLSGG